MAGTLKKALQALGIWILVILIVATIWPPALHLPQLWMVASVGILANILQPAYRPFEGSRTPEDRRTVGPPRRSFGLCISRRPRRCSSSFGGDALPYPSIWLRGRRSPQ